MRTVTYQINHWTNDDTGGNGDCFEVIETETLHIVGGDDEYSSCGIAGFGTEQEAKQFIQKILMSIVS